MLYIHESAVAPSIETMIRDMELIRDLLFRIEADPKCNGRQWVPFDRGDYLCGHSAEEVAYGLSILHEGGLILASTSGSTPMVSRLTWNGHEFLDSIKDPGIWKSTKEKMAGLSGVTLSVVTAIATAEIKKKLHLP